MISPEKTGALLLRRRRRCRQTPPCKKRGRPPSTTAIAEHCNETRTSSKPEDQKLLGRTYAQGVLNGVAQVVSTCVRSIGTLNSNIGHRKDAHSGINAQRRFPMPSAPSFSEAGPPMSVEEDGHSGPSLANGEHGRARVPNLCDGNSPAVTGLTERRKTAKAALSTDHQFPPTSGSHLMTFEPCEQFLAWGARAVCTALP